MARTLEQRIDDWIGNGDGPFSLETEMSEFIRAAYADDGIAYAPDDVRPLMRQRIADEQGEAE